MKSLRKITALVLALVFLIPSTIAFADSSQPTFTYPCQLTWNIKSIYYYRDSSANKYATPISGAANNWFYTGYGNNNLYPCARTTNIVNSAVDIYTYNEDDGYLGETFLYARTGGTTGEAYEVDPWHEDWLYCEIKLNDDNLQWYVNQEGIQGVVAHELGHCWGLMHNNDNPYSIMCQTSSGRLTNKVGKVDQEAFVGKYG